MGEPGGAEATQRPAARTWDKPDSDDVPGEVSRQGLDSLTQAAGDRLEAAQWAKLHRRPRSAVTNAGADVPHDYPVIGHAAAEDPAV
jgi:hypothetical protein